ncbi:MAG: hypothetical protein PHX61_02665 [Alphaproteobacteria bacterium]|nr:hypothetical protein [Alphaproteobacteria bacterium]
MTEQPKEFIVIQWDKVEIIQKALNAGITPGTPNDVMAMVCNAHRVLLDAPVSTPPEGAAPDTEDFNTALKCFGYCGKVCDIECNIKSCCIQAGAIAQAAREKVLEELKTDLKTRFISSSNQWSKGRNSGLLECCNIINESLRQGKGTNDSNTTNQSIETKISELKKSVEEFNKDAKKVIKYMEGKNDPGPKRSN